MLVLTRKVGQSLLIDGTILVTVLAVEGERVKVGVEAPPEVSVLRGELYHELRGENLRAAEAGGEAVSLLRRLLDEVRSKGPSQTPHGPASKAS